jgi:hypothetical protein
VFRATGGKGQGQGVGLSGWLHVLGPVKGFQVAGWLIGRDLRKGILFRGCPPAGQRQQHAHLASPLTMLPPSTGHLPCPAAGHGGSTRGMISHRLQQAPVWVGAWHRVAMALGLKGAPCPVLGCVAGHGFAPWTAPLPLSHGALRGGHLPAGGLFASSTLAQAERLPTHALGHCRVPRGAAAYYGVLPQPCVQSNCWAVWVHAAAGWCPACGCLWIGWVSV